MSGPTWDAGGRAQAGGEQREELQIGTGKPRVAERAVAGVAGGLLAAYGIKRRGLPGALMTATGGLLVYGGASGHTVGEAVTAIRRPARIEVQRAITVNLPVEPLFQFWRNPANMPRIMPHIESVEVLDDRRSIWRTRRIAGRALQWECLIDQDVPNQMVGWRASRQSKVLSTGSVRFRPAPGGRGVEVHLKVEYQPPAGRVGHAAAKLLGEDPLGGIRESLRRFKQLMEAGEMPVTKGQPSAHHLSIFGKLGVVA